MAEDEDEDEFLQRYEIDGVVAQIERVLGGKSPCPMCHVDDWLIEYRKVPYGTLGTELTPVFVSKDPRGREGTGGAIPAVAFTCSNCGFLRLHNWSWMMSKTDTEGQDGEG